MSIDALMLLVEKIYDACRGRRVLSLVTFHVQGPYKGVNKDVLKDRLQALTIPERLAEWIYFINVQLPNRLASQHFGTVWQGYREKQKFRAHHTVSRLPGKSRGT
jgi:hypothetical protein